MKTQVWGVLIVLSIALLTGCTKKAEESATGSQSANVTAPAPVPTMVPGAVKPGPPLNSPADSSIPGQFPQGSGPTR
jgi:hypothetical protein